MKQVTEAEMLAGPAEVLKWVKAGEEVEISQDGVVTAHLVPVKRVMVKDTNGSRAVDWSNSEAFTRDRSKEHFFTDEEVRSLLG